MNSFTDEEAALYAKIGVRTLYKYIERNPEFGQRKEQLKLHPNLKAKQTIVSSLGQLPAAQWWADRKSIDLMPQSKVVHAGKIETETKGESTQQVKEIVTRFESELKSAIAKAHGK